MDWYCAEYEEEKVYELHDGQTATGRDELDTLLLTTIDQAANPPVVLAVGVSRQTEFRGRTLYRGWNYVVMR